MDIDEECVAYFHKKQHKGVIITFCILSTMTLLANSNDRLSQYAGLKQIQCQQPTLEFTRTGIPSPAIQLVASLTTTPVYVWWSRNQNINFTLRLRGNAS